VSSRWQRLTPPVAVWLAAAAWAIPAALVAISQHRGFRPGYDLAAFDQVLWLVSQWQEPLITEYGRHYFGDHFGPTILLFTPIYLAGGGVEALLTAQTVCLAITAPLLYHLARAYGASPRLATLPALLWLASPLTMTVQLFEFHHAAVAAPLLVGSLLALKRDRLLLFSLLAVMAAGTKEDIPLVLAALGVVLALEGRRRLGAIVATAALAYFAVVVGVVIPHFSDSLAWFARRFAGDRGDSMPDVAVWILSHPIGAVQDVATRNNMVMCLALLVTTGGLCLLAPRWMLLGAPVLAHNLLSAYPPQQSLTTQYHLPIATA
jgi:uncharacterized membrane protein